MAKREREWTDVLCLQCQPVILPFFERWTNSGVLHILFPFYPAAFWIKSCQNRQKSPHHLASLLLGVSSCLSAPIQQKNESRTNFPLQNDFSYVFLAKKHLKMNLFSGKNWKRGQTSNSRSPPLTIGILGGAFTYTSGILKCSCLWSSIDLCFCCVKTPVVSRTQLINMSESTQPKQEHLVLIMHVWTCCK